MKFEFNNPAYPVNSTSSPVVQCYNFGVIKNSIYSKEYKIMNYELAKFANRGTFKWIGTFQGFSTERDYFAHKDIEKVILSDVQTPDGNSNKRSSETLVREKEGNRRQSLDRFRYCALYTAPRLLCFLP